MFVWLLCVVWPCAVKGQRRQRSTQKCPIHQTNYMFIAFIVIFEVFHGSSVCDAKKFQSSILLRDPEQTNHTQH